MQSPQSESKALLEQKSQSTWASYKHLRDARPVLNAFMVAYLMQRLLQRPVSHHVGAPGSRGTEQLELRHQNTHGENEDGRTHPHLHLFFGVVRRVQMVMHAMWMINNEGRMKHTGLSK